MLEVVFSSFWTWGGTLILVASFGYCLSLPFFWHARGLEQKRLLENEEEARFYRFHTQQPPLN